MQKNVAGQKWVVFAFQDEGGTNPGEPVTGDAANITANLRIDGGAANAVDDTNPTELENGYYVFDITAAESNGENIVICPASSTANVNVIGVPGAVYTTPANFPDLTIGASTGRVDVGQIEGSDATDQINAACDAALTDYDAVVPADLPTNFADLSITATTGRVDVAAIAGTAQTANDNGADINSLITQIGTDGDGLTSIPWNAAWDAEVQSEVNDALVAYDPPTRTELTSDINSVLQALGVNVTTIATLASQTSFTLTAGSADDDAYNNWAILVIDQSTSAQRCLGIVNDYTGSTRTITLRSNPGVFTMATGDTVVLIPAFLEAAPDVNVASINDVTVTGAGTSGDLWRA